MGELLTERLGLIKPNRDTNTPLDVTRLNLNMDTLDRATGGAIVADGAIPPTVELYDGKIVVEKPSGAVWVAEKQSNGSYAKKWISYPYHYTAVTTALTFQCNGQWTPWGWNYYAAYGQLNTSPSDFSNNFWKCPFTGLWRIQYTDLFFSPSGAQPAKGQYRGCMFTIDGVDDYPSSLSQHFYGLGYYNENTGDMSNNFASTRFINVGTIVGHKINVDNSGQVDIHSSFSATAVQRMD